MSAEIVKRPIPPLEFSPEQRRIILDTFLNGASEAEAAVLLELARLRHLNPITRQIHFVKRPQKQRDGTWREVWAAQVGIDGFRAIGERTGLYDGQDEPEFEYGPDGKVPKVCRVRVYRKDWTRPVVGVAHYAEYVQTTKDGRPNVMWASKPHIMLAKCAEALAMRKAFPEDTSGLYVPEEMPPEEKEINSAPEISQGGKVPELMSGNDRLLQQLKASVEQRVVELPPAPKSPERAGLQVWLMLKSAATSRGISEKELKDAIKRITGKSGTKALAQSDEAKVIEWMADEPPPVDDVPPPSDADAPGVES
jgi:phage recombination protein Bet